MISADITKTKDSLNKAIVDIRQAFLVMVKEYSKDVAHTAIDKTPFGNSANDYYRLYSRLRYIPDEAGYAKGGWVLSTGTASTVEFPARADNASADNIKSAITTQANSYRLGEDIYITNNVPYVSQAGWTLEKFGSLEGGYSRQAPNGIMKPTFDIAYNILSKNLVQYYNKSRSTV